MPNPFLDRQRALKQATQFADAPIGKVRVKKKDQQGMMDGYTTPGAVGGAAVGKALKKRKPY